MKYHQCVCIADHNLDGKRVRCLHRVERAGQKCENCKAGR